MTTVCVMVPAVMFTEMVPGTGIEGGIGTVGWLREKLIEVPIVPVDGITVNAPGGIPGVV